MAPINDKKELAVEILKVVVGKHEQIIEWLEAIYLKRMLAVCR